MKKKNILWTALGAVLGIILLTAVIAVGVKIGNSGLKKSIQDWKDGINDVINKDDPSSTGPAETTQALQWNEHALLTF